MNVGVLGLGAMPPHGPQPPRRNPSYHRLQPDALKDRALRGPWRDRGLDEVHPALVVIGDPIVHCGPVGAGTKTRLFTNLLLGNLLQAYSEALVFGKKHGLFLTAESLAFPSFYW